MPELPEVETTVNGMRPFLEGEVLKSVEPRRPDLRWPMPVDLRQRMTGATITGMGRRAKYGLIETDRGDTMIFHLGMSGHWRIDPTEIGKHDHLLIETMSGHVLALNDPRRFGSIDLVRTDELDSFKAFAKMGPEPLSDVFDAKYLKQIVVARKTSIKNLLLDQRIVAGLGNIYVCESLHIAKIHPAKPGAEISMIAYKRLVSAIKDVLIAAIAAGGSTIKDFAQPDGELGYFAKQWLVYGREGEPCSCGKPVLRRVDGGRSTFYCEKCQR